MIELLWNNPISEAKMQQYIEALQLAPSKRVLDIGCGCGEILIRIHERYGMNGVGIDNKRSLIAEATKRADGRARTPSVEFAVADATTYDVASQSIDLVVCLGATHAFGLGSNAYSNALSQIMPMLNSGGLVLVGDGYLKQPAAKAYRELLGDDVPDGTTHESNVQIAQTRGLIPLGAWTSSLDEWDAFEWGYQQIVESKAIAGDKTAIGRLAARRNWMQMYLKHGRETLGFGVYLFRKP